MTFFDLSSAGTHPDYTVKIYFRILRDGGGNGGYDITKLPDVMNVLDEAFNPHGIYFEYVCEKNYLDNQNLVENGSTIANFCLWSEIPRADDGITIYIVKGFELGPGYRGHASGITGDFMVLQEGVGNNNPVIESTTIIHEMGHLFGLFHMFHGSTQNLAIWDHPFYADVCNNEPSENICESPFICRYSEIFFNCETGIDEVDLLECAEDMTNGAIAGDYIPDTPPSHGRVENEALSFECEGRIDRIVYNEVDGGNPNFPQILDPQGNFYNPDYTNFISIASSPSSLDCRDHFTPNQITVMKNHIAGHPKLTHVTVTDPEPRCACTYDSQIFIEEPANWSQIVSGENLSMTELMDREVVVHDKLFLNINYDFRGVTFRMGPNAEIVIESGSSISTGESSASGRRTTFMSCSSEQTWNRILVEDGGSLALRDADIYGGTNQVMANDGSNLFVDNCVMLAADNYAIQVEGDVQTGDPQAIFCRDTKITDAKNGILFARNPNNHLIDNVQIGYKTNSPATNFGIAIFESSAIVQNSYIKSNYGFFLFEANGAIIRNNPFINYNQYGIFAWRSNNLLVEGNKIGSPFSESRIAIGVFDVPSLNINNNEIFAKQFGISASITSPLIEDNIIDVLPSEGNTAAGGIRLAASDGGNIFDNIIDCNQASFGIESSNNRNTEITSNSITINNIPNIRTGGIRSLGGNTETIEDNLIQGEINIGVYIQNSINNTINCNDVVGATEAIGIYQNAQGQTITGNEMIESGLDLTIRSVIGRQDFHGNTFEGGETRAIGLSFEEIDESRFFVNDLFNFHLPANPIPGGDAWFRINPNEFNFETCSGEAGTPTSTPPFWGNKELICATYYRSLEDPVVYHNFISQLLNYEKIDSEFILPECINTNEADYQVIARLTTVWDGLLNIAKPTINTEISTEIESLQREYTNAEDIATAENVRTTLRERLVEYQASFTADKISRKNTIQSLGNYLLNTTTNNEQLTYSKDILINYTESLRAEDILATEINWNTYASLCSDRYGALVHLARTMANQSDNNYFDIFDDCMPAELYESNELNNTSAKSIKLSITPNPSNGHLQIDLGSIQSGTLSIVDMFGQLFYKHQINEAQSFSLSLDVPSGVYLVKMKDLNGIISTKKIIITK